MSPSKKIDLKRDFPAGVYLSARPNPLLGFYLGFSSNFVGSESGQIQSVKLLHNMVSDRTLYGIPPPPPLHKAHVYFFTQ
jgi:hypothetical protein